MTLLNENVHAIDLWASDLRYVVRERRNTPLNVLRGVDLSLRAGRVTGVLGPNGSGKTTLMRVIIGALQATGGEVVVGGLPAPGRTLADVPGLERARLLAMVEQDAQAHQDFTVAEVISLGRLPHRGRFQGADPSDTVPTHAAERAGVAHLRERVFQTLSGGERQRVHLARALAQSPRVLLLDEPTNHLDIAAQLDLLGLVRSVAEDGVGVLLTLHDLTLAARVCDEVVVVKGGGVAASGAPLDVLTPQLIREVWGVDATWLHAGGTSALIFN